jgi:hypothetical protein
MRWAGYVARIGKMRNVYKILITKTPNGRRKEDNSQVHAYLEGIGYEYVDQIYVSQLRVKRCLVMNTVKNPRPSFHRKILLRGERVVANRHGKF